jgi:hypothetical protein
MKMFHSTNNSIANVNSIYLSAFGSDSNNGLSSTSAVLTLSRAYALAYAQSSANATILMAPGVIALGQPRMDNGVVNIIGAGPLGNAAIYKFSCGGSGDTLGIGTRTSIVGVSFDGCTQAVTVYRPSATFFVELTNVVFENTANALFVGDAVATLNITNARFSGQALTLSRTSSYVYAANVYFYQSQFTSTTGAAIIDTANAANSYPVSGSILIDGSLFLATAPAVNVWVRNGFGSIAIADSTFKGPANANGCSVRLDNVKSQITNTVFESHSGSPALCVVGGNAAIINSEFNGNQGNNTATGASLAGAGIYVSGATLAISTTKFKSNKFDGDGAAIHCESSRLTVGSSTFSYNTAGGSSAACSSLSCTVVSFNNTQYRNVDRSQTNSCNLQ